MAYLSPEPLRSFSGSSFNGSYMPIGTPLANDAVRIRVYNNTNQALMMSMDGVIDAAYIDSNQVLDFVCTPGVNAVQAGTQFYVKGMQDIYNQGFVYLSAFHD